MGCREAGDLAVPWDSLVDDVKPAILSHLSLPDSARAAVTCREFQDAYRVRLAAEQQNFVTLTEETFSQALVRALVGAIRQAMCKSGRQQLDWVPKDQWATVTIDMSGCLHPEAESAFPHNKSLAILHAHPRSPWLDVVPGPFTSLGGLIFHGKECGRWKSMNFDVIKYSNNDARVSLRVTADKAVAPAAVGLLLATCAGYKHMPEDSEVVPARWDTPATVALVLWDFPLGARGKKEAECLIAPVRHLAESVVIKETGTAWRVGLEPACTVPEASVDYPLGHLRVWIVIPDRRLGEG
jgi:hypothetical protein